MADEVEATEDAPAEDAVAAPEIPTRYGVPCTESRGQVVLHPGRENLAELVMDLRDEHGFNVCIDVTAVDYLAFDPPRLLPDGVEAERFELIVGLLSHGTRERLRLRVQVPEGDPTVPSLFDVHPGTEALEREVYDMYGIRFEGHPDL